jgi:glycine oxidase
MTNSAHDSNDITVVGGGVIGMSIAWEMASIGYRVRLVDASRLGTAASWAAAGILPATPPLASELLEPIECLRSLSHELYPDWTRKIKDYAGIDTEFRPCGGVFLSRSRGEHATMLAQEIFWHEQGVQASRFSMQQLAASHSTLAALANRLESSTTSTTAWFTPGECTVRTPRLLQGLKRACHMAGVEILENCEIKEIEIQSDNQPITLHTSQHSWQSQYVCVSSGAWTQRLLQPLGLQTGILPVRGQMLLYKFDVPPFPMIINEGHRYFVPRLDGHVLAGSCEEEVGFDISNTDEKITELKSWVDTLMPDWNDRHFVSAWAGLRPGSFDGLPYIGSLPDHPNLIVASGHYRSGVHLAPGTAKIVASLVTQMPLPIDISAFHLTRGAILAGSSQLSEI